MKKVFLVLVTLALIFGACIPAFSQPSMTSVESSIIDNFDTDPTDWKWTVNASRFITEGYPKFSYFPGISNSLKPFHTGDKDPRVFGVQAAFDRKGDNWFEIIPTKDDKPYEIPLVGHVATFDFWVWGSNYLYFIDLLVRDANGIVHVLPAGNLAFNGWKNIVVKIPGWMVQKSKLRSGPKNLTFLGFRIRSDSSESVDDFAIYFDNFRVMTNPLSTIFDGYELLDTDFSNAESGSKAGSNSNSESNSNSGTGDTGTSEGGNQ